MIEVTEQAIPLTLSLSTTEEVDQIEKHHPLDRHIQTIERIGPYGHVTLHIASYPAHNEVTQLILTSTALKSLETVSSRAQSGEIRRLFTTASTLFSSYQAGESSDYIDWSLIGSNLIRKRREFLKQIDLYKTYDNQHHLISKLLIEIIEYYLNEYLIEQENFSKDEASRIEFYFRQAIKEQSYLKYFIKAYTLTNSFYRVLNKHLALYILDYFDTSSYASSPTKYRLINCLVHIVTLLIHHPDIDQYKYQGITYRGLLMTEKELKHYHVGNHILNRSFVSTSKSQRIAQVFAGNSQDCALQQTSAPPGVRHVSVLLKYTIKQLQTAIDIEHLSVLQEEEEVLILPFSVFQVKQRFENDRKTCPPILVEIELEECEDSEQEDSPRTNPQHPRRKITASNYLYGIVGLLVIFGLVLMIAFTIVWKTRSKPKLQNAFIDDSVHDTDQFQSPCPPIANRSVWNARPYVTRQNLTTSPIAYIVIRHVPNSNPLITQLDCIKTMIDLQEFQMKERGWLDVGYNFFICNDQSDQPRIYQGRGWMSAGAHCIGYNYRSLGKWIGVLGDYTSWNSLNTFKALIQCGISKKVIGENFTLVGHLQSPTIYEYYLEHLKSTDDLHFSDQDGNTTVFCEQ